MNATPSLADWAEWLLRLSLGSTAIVLLTALAACWVRSAGWQRTLWRGCLLGLAVFVVGESLGAGAMLSAWLEPALIPEPIKAVPLAAQAGEEQRRRLEPREMAGRGAADHFVEITQGDVAADRIAESRLSPVWWPGVLWLAGTGLLLSRFVVGRGLLLVFRRRCQPLRGGAVVERVQCLAARLGIRRSIVILQAGGSLGPAAFGVWRPMLVLPANFDGDFAPPAQEAMLAHELAHLAARDPAWQVLADLVTALVWWQPLVWWARCRLRAAGEAAADDASLLVADGPGVLASCLVELGKRLSSARRPAWLGASGNGFRSGLGRRVQRLLQLGQQSWQPPRRRRAGLLVLVATLTLGGGCLVGTSWAQSRILAHGDPTMKKNQLSWQRSLAGVVLFSTFGIGAEGVAAAQPSGPRVQQKEPTKQVSGPGAIGPGGVGAPKPGVGESEPAGDDGDRQVLKVYRLRYRDPETVANIANMLLNQWLMQQNMPGMPGPGPMFPGQRLPHGEAPGLPGPGGLGLGGPLGPGLGALGGGGLGLGGFGLGGPGVGGPLSSVRFAPDKRTGTLLVRGEKSELELVTDLVKILDVPALTTNKQAPKVKGLHVFRLKHADPKTISDALNRLDIHVRLAIDPERQALIVLPDAPDDDAREIRQVVDALDVPVPKKDAKIGEGK